MHSSSQGMNEARSLFKPIYTLIKGRKKAKRTFYENIKICNVP